MHTSKWARPCNAVYVAILAGCCGPSWAGGGTTASQSGPVITSVSHRRIYANAPYVETVRGSGFQNGCTISFEGSTIGMGVAGNVETGVKLTREVNALLDSYPQKEPLTIENPDGGVCHDHARRGRLCAEHHEHFAGRNVCRIQIACNNHHRRRRIQRFFNRLRRRRRAHDHCRVADAAYGRATRNTLHKAAAGRSHRRQRRFQLELAPRSRTRRHLV